MRSQTVSTGCDGPEGKGRPRAPRRQDAIGARAGHGGIRRRARRCAVHGRIAGRACQGDGGRAVCGACAHVGLPSPAACCLGVGGGRVRVLVCKMFREDTGQATVEAAFALPIALVLVILLVQPGILLYDRIVMQQAAAETCRLLATTPEGDPSGVCRAFARCPSRIASMFTKEAARGRWSLRAGSRAMLFACALRRRRSRCRLSGWAPAF